MEKKFVVTLVDGGIVYLRDDNGRTFKMQSPFFAAGLEVEIKTGAIEPCGRYQLSSWSVEGDTPTAYMLDVLSGSRVDTVHGSEIQIKWSHTGLNWGRRPDGSFLPESEPYID